MSKVELALVVSLIPFFAVWVAIYFPFIKSSKRTAPYIQSMASGFITGSILVDLMPRVLSKGLHASYVIAFIIGFVFMLSIQKEESGCCGNGNSSKPLTTFLVPFVVEFFVTAVLIGIASVTNAALLVMIAVSFGLCNFVCGLSISSRITHSQVTSFKRFGITLLITLIYPIFSSLSAALVAYIPMGWIHDLLSFTVAALLYLVLFELLPEVMSAKNKATIAVFFSSITFVFILLYLIH